MPQRRDLLQGAPSQSDMLCKRIDASLSWFSSNEIPLHVYNFVLWQRSIEMSQWGTGVERAIQRTVREPKERSMLIALRSFHPSCFKNRSDSLKDKQCMHACNSVRKTHSCVHLHWRFLPLKALPRYFNSNKLLLSSLINFELRHSAQISHKSWWGSSSRCRRQHIYEVTWEAQTSCWTYCL